jgi:hypothetical protein
MSRFHNFSFGNILTIARQKPDPSRLATIYKTNDEGGRRLPRYGELEPDTCARSQLRPSSKPIEHHSLAEFWHFILAAHYSHRSVKPIPA